MRVFRTVTSAAAIVVGAVCLAAWALSGVVINSVTDSDTFAGIATRIINSPDVTQAITVQAQAVAQEEFRRQGVDLEAFGAAGLVNTAIEDAVKSDDFAIVMAPQIEDGHRQFVVELTLDAREPAPLVLSFDVTEVVNQRLESEPLLGSFVSNVDLAPVRVEVVDADAFEQARTGYAALDLVHAWGLWTGLALLLGGFLVSPRRRWYPAKSALAVGVCGLTGWALVAWQGPSAIARRFDTDADTLEGALGEVVSAQTVEAAADRLLVWAVVALAAALLFGAVALVTRAENQRGMRHAAGQ